MTPTEEYGYEFAKGFFKYAILLAAWLILCVVLGTSIFNALSIGVDDSDLSAWKRSGLKIHTDYKTGTQYLSDGKGGLVPRILPAEKERR